MQFFSAAVPLGDFWFSANWFCRSQTKQFWGFWQKNLSQTLNSMLMKHGQKIILHYIPVYLYFILIKSDFVKNDLLYFWWMRCRSSKKDTSQHISVFLLLQISHVSCTHSVQMELKAHVFRPRVFWRQLVWGHNV